MKRIFSIVLTLLLLLALLSCDAGGGAETGGSPVDETTADNSTRTPYTPKWHLSETLEYDLLLPDSPTDVGVKVPLVYEATEHGFFFRFEFFEEFYPIGSMMQVRISVTNNTSEDIVYQANSWSMLDILYRESDEAKDALRFLSVLEPNGEKIIYYTDDILSRDFPAGETLVFERAVRVSPDYFSVGDTYQFGFAIVDISQSIYSAYSVAFPISVVNRYE